ncbi:MAG TPA: hypothetical protein VFD36_20585 [Kofleriaceae bacterium]|nr:hypothetical protein [Kofleriaceae bacterium]
MTTLTNNRLIVPAEQREVLWRVALQRHYRIGKVRIYEKEPTLRDATALDVLADAFEVANKDSVDEVIRDSGIVGQWRPSAILIHRVAVGTDFIVQNVIAHSLWNTAFDVVGLPGMDVQIYFENDEARERIVWPHVICDDEVPRALLEDRLVEYERVIRDMNRRLDGFEAGLRALRDRMAKEKT